MRRLGIAGIIAALFVLGTAGPTSAIAVETPGDGPDAPEPATPDPGAEQEPPSEVCQAIEDVQAGAADNDAPDDFVNGLEHLQGELGCPGAEPPPGDDDDADDPLASLEAELCPVLDDVISEAEANDAPAEFLGALNTVRNDVLECPTPKPPPAGDDDDSDNGDDDDDRASGDDDDTSTPPDPQVAAGGVGGTGTGGAELPRTGAPSLTASLGFGAAGLGAALRKLFLR